MNKNSQVYFEKNNDELNIELNKLKADLYALRFKHATNQLPNALVIRDTKRNIARVKTVLRLRELNLAVEPAKAAKSSDKADKAKKAKKAK